MKTILFTLAITLSFYSTLKAQYNAPLDQYAVTYSSGNYVFWKPYDPSPTITYDVSYHCANYTCQGTIVILAENAILSTYGYIGVQLPSGISLPGFQISIYPHGCSPSYSGIAFKTGDVISDNIDAAWTDGTKLKMVGGDAACLSSTARSVCDDQEGVKEETYSLITTLPGGCTPVCVYPTVSWNTVTEEYNFTTAKKVPFVCIYNFTIQCNSGYTEPWQLTVTGDLSNSNDCVLPERIANSSASAFYIAPNPAEGYFIIRNLKAGNEPVSMKIYDAAGRAVKEWNHIM